MVETKVPIEAKLLKLIHLESAVRNIFKQTKNQTDNVSVEYFIYEEIVGIFEMRAPLL